MKNVTVTVGDGTVEHVRALWRTDLFRAAHHAPGGYVNDIVRRFARLPRLWCDLSEPRMERSHFLTWMGVVPHRDEYTNDAISDLYYLHEYVHAADLVYAPHDEDAAFARRIWENERDASLCSEVFIYFAVPGLRDRTFSFEIWADRYLADPARVAQWREDRAGFVAFFQQERARAMATPTAGDENERLISAYDDANHAWAEIWRDRWREVETALHSFAAHAATAPTEAAHALRGFLERAQAGGVTPYEREARAYADAIARLLR